MIPIKLKRSGGMLGKTLQATGHVDMNAEDLIKKLKTVAPPENPFERDNLYTSITIKGKDYPVDMGLLKGHLKKIVTQLEGQLKADKI